MWLWREETRLPGLWMIVRAVDACDMFSLLGLCDYLFEVSHSRLCL